MIVQFLYGVCPICGEAIRIPGLERSLCSTHGWVVTLKETSIKKLSPQPKPKSRSNRSISSPAECEQMTLF
ncbi:MULTISPECIES: hypothetical protein [Leptolyngbya]|uniref:hypothetical protein n=1 Tax=Leptolyngbya TaxID=47251 RepID=UPI001684F8DF|nr:hypothetical protein [Leptolyngbya sp. FACHB-1624]MBD1854786.1 hypothetical protein [Leptolyngbya sp. FACHB-1624]